MTGVYLIKAWTEITSIHPASTYPIRQHDVDGACHSKRRGIPWMGHQSFTGLTQTQTTIHTYGQFKMAQHACTRTVEDSRRYPEGWWLNPQLLQYICESVLGQDCEPKMTNHGSISVRNNTYGYEVIWHVRYKQSIQFAHKSAELIGGGWQLRLLWDFGNDSLWNVTDSILNLQEESQTDRMAH